jgi:hypothetical protein
MLPLLDPLDAAGAEVVAWDVRSLLHAETASSALPARRVAVRLDFLIKAVPPRLLAPAAATTRIAAVYHHRTPDQRQRPGFAHFQVWRIDASAADSALFPVRSAGEARPICQAGCSPI